MEKISTREKRIYEISKEEFLKGEWLTEIKNISKDYTRLEVKYTNNILNIVLFNKKNINPKALKE